MPTIAQASVQITEFPSRFISPFGRDLITPLYSSIPIITNDVNCLPCVVCGTSVNRHNVIYNQSQKYANYDLANPLTVSIST